MRGVQVDPEARLARVQGGAVLGDVDRETQVFGLATPFGVASETGVAGLTLGGGYGWLRRKHGLACDNLVSAQVVGADGEVRTASAETNPELLWALRGGGGNFGVVTSFTFRLHPVGPVVAFAGVFYPVESAAEVLRGYRDYFASAPDEVSSEALSLTFPADPGLPEPIHDQQCFVVGAVYAGDADQGMHVLQPLRELATPLADISQPMPFAVVQSAFDAFFPRGLLRAYWKSAYVPELSDEVIEIVARRSAERPSGLTFVDVYPMGGEVARVGPDESAFGERAAQYMLSVAGNWPDAGDDEANIAWVREAWAEVDALGTGSTYLNFTGPEDPTASSVPHAFGRNIDRLTEVKARYDPGNLFRRNNNIQPSTA
jgi:FAD/FMN-containing dehydrogenase